MHCNVQTFDWLQHFGTLMRYLTYVTSALIKQVPMSSEMVESVRTNDTLLPNCYCKLKKVSINYYYSNEDIRRAKNWGVGIPKNKHLRPRQTKLGWRVIGWRVILFFTIIICSITCLEQVNFLLVNPPLNIWIHISLTCKINKPDLKEQILKP